MDIGSPVVVQLCQIANAARAAQRQSYRCFVRHWLCTFEELESLFSEYAESGTGKRRRYLHTEEEAETFGQEPGTFTHWENIPQSADLLFYEGLHGGVVNGRVNVAKYVDLLVGVVPIVNPEWIQKIHRDTADRGYRPELVASRSSMSMPALEN